MTMKGYEVFMGAAAQPPSPTRFSKSAADLVVSYRVSSGLALAPSGPAIRMRYTCVTTRAHHTYAFFKANRCSAGAMGMG